jgi:hypothetical protein
MSGKWYQLKEELKQEHFYRIIYSVERYGYIVSIDTDIEHLSIGEIDENDLNTYEELEKILSGDSVYEKIGFLMMEQVKINKLDIHKKDFRMSIYPNSVYSNNEIEELKKVVMYCGFNPNYWLVEEKNLDSTGV